MTNLGSGAHSIVGSLSTRRISGSAWIAPALAMFGIAWGANTFTPLLLIYRKAGELSESGAAAAFAAYAVGVIVMLPISGRYSDRRGRRGVVRAMILLAIISSVVLTLGAGASGLLYLGRALGGMASGAAFTACTAWIHECSTDAALGARRSALSLSAGLAGGPLLTGLIGQWAPAPRVTPYVVHVVIMLLIAIYVWNAPEPASPPKMNGGKAPAFVPASVKTRNFALGLAAWAPLVFATASTGLAVLPTLVAHQLGGYRTLSTGVMDAATLGAGVLVQPIARRWSGSPIMVRRLGISAAAIGFAMSASVVSTRSVTLAVAACVVLGGAYGALLVSGLGGANRIAEPESLGQVVAAFYVFVYIGMGAPYAFTLIAGAAGAAGTLLGAALLAAVALLLPATQPAAAR